MATFNEYIQNPMGIKNSVFSHREMYRTMYSDKLDKIMMREVGNATYQLYSDKDNFYVHMKVPSEVVPGFRYDTVIMFYPGDGTVVDVETTLNNYQVKFFSNDPSFVFTFAYSFLKNNIFIKDLVPRMSKKAVIDAAKVKNASNQVGYVKSIYFTFLLMKRYGLFNKSMFKLEGSKYSKTELLKNVQHSDKVIQDRQELGKQVAEDKRKEKKANSPKAAKRTTSNMSSKQTNITSTTQKSVTKNIVNKTKKSSIVKRK